MPKISINKNDTINNTQLTKDVRRGNATNIESFTVNENVTQDTNDDITLVVTYSDRVIDTGSPPSSLNGHTLASGDTVFLLLQNGVYTYDGTELNYSSQPLHVKSTTHSREWKYATSNQYVEITSPQAYDISSLGLRGAMVGLRDGDVLYETDAENGSKIRYEYFDGSFLQSGWGFHAHNYNLATPFVISTSNTTEADFHAKASTTYWVKATIFLIGYADEMAYIEFVLPSTAGGNTQELHARGSQNLNNGGGRYNGDVYYPQDGTNTISLPLSISGSAPYGFVEYEGMFETDTTAGRAGINVITPVTAISGTTSVVQPVKAKIEWKEVI
jgi:hypothetical protein